MTNLSSLPMCILEEIGFEGLEGITIEGLWKRISVRAKLPFPLNNKIENEIWKFVVSAKCLQFYEHEEEREPFKIFDRTEYVDPFFGATEPESCPYNFYKYNPIKTQDVQGSCEHFDTRTEIARDVVAKKTADQIETKYGRRFVIVATQSLRTSLLIPPWISKEIDLNIIGYCILERLGRARYNGELAQGKYSLADIGGDPVAFHNQKKKLLRNKLIESQSFSQHIEGTNMFGQLIHLPRFFAQFKPRHMIMMEKVINILKSKPNCMAEYQEVKSGFEEFLHKPLSRLFKSPFFHKFVLTDTKVPFRAIYPNATEREWKLPKKETERTLNVLQLRDANIDPSQFWDKFEGDANEPDDEMEDGDFLDDSHVIRELPLLHQLYKYIESKKEVGVSESEARAYLGQSRLNGRALVKNLTKTSLIDFYISSNKRQTVRRFILSKYKKQSKQSIADKDPLRNLDENGTLNSHDLTRMMNETTLSRLEFEQSELTEVTCDVIEEGDVSHNQSEEMEQSEVSQEIDYDEPFKTERDERRSHIDGNISVNISEITETNHNKSKKKTQGDLLTDKTEERLKFILAEVNSKILFDDPAKLYNALTREEQLRGLADKMCRKTFFRLLTFMCKRNQLRLWRIEFQFETKHRSLMYISNRTVDSSYSLMQSCIEQAKSRFKLSIFDEENRKESKKQKSSQQNRAENRAEREQQVEQGQRLTSSAKRSFNYGTTPKFIRLRTLHEFMFYLSREYEQSEQINNEEIIAQWAESSPVGVSDIDSMPEIWDAEIGWKSFVPPLIKHNGFDKGWCLLSDCIFRMPLSIFVKVVNIAYEIKGLDEFVSHPIKKHFLVKDIPVHLQKMLFSRRKYIASLHELIRRLICMGLVQAGPHRALKDQAFYYMNRFATLIDTSTSLPGSYYVSDQEYPQHLYKFEALDDVYTYWDDMHRICMSTKLHRKPTQEDQTPADKIFPNKFAVYVKAIQPRQAIGRDLGELPGDHRGAAGLDSYFFAHLERNWAFNSTKFKPKFVTKMILDGSAPMRYSRLVRMTRDANLRKQESRIAPVPLHKLKSAALRRRVPIRKRTGVVKKKRIRNKYDDIDRLAIQHMCKLRVDWNEQEDSFLLLCRVAQMYLNPKNLLVMSGQVVRDLLHWNCKSLNKTTYACRRRIVYITKKLPNSAQINNSITMCLSEVKGNKSIHKRYGDNFLSDLKKVYPNDLEFTIAFQVHFIDLVHTLSCQYYNLTNSFASNPLHLPRTLQEFDTKFAERTDSSYDSNTIRYDEPKSVDDVKIATIVNLIHSTVCCCYDKTSWSIQLYEIYKDFPEQLLSLAMHKVRSDQLITQFKIKNAYNRAYNRCLPLSSSGFHLSATYQQQMTTKISYDIFDDSYSNVKCILDDVNEFKQSHVLNLAHSAICFFISELMQNKNYDIGIEVPKRVLLLDPTKQIPETFEGLYARFREIFNFIPKVDLVGPDGSTLDDFISDLPDDEDKSTVNETDIIIKKLENLPTDSLHFMCIVDNFGTTKPRNQIELTEDGKCPFNCIRELDNPLENIMEKLIVKREVWYRFNIEQFEPVPLPAVVTIDEMNIVAIYNYLILKGANATDEQHNANWYLFKQISDIVDELLLENDKDLIDEDFGAEYDLRSDVKKKLHEGSHTNDKIHKFHDFLCVNTCKLTMIPKNINEDERLDVNQLNKKRDGILAKIVQNSNWSSELKPNIDFVALMEEKGLNLTEIHIAIDICNYIDSQGEMGANAASLLERYEDKTFLQRVLNYFNESKLVMKTGVCEVTYVHGKHIKPWIVNTYHLKRLDREAIVPTTKSLLQVSDTSESPGPSHKTKRKNTEEELGASKRIKRTRLDDTADSNESQTNETLNDLEEDEERKEIIVPDTQSESSSRTENEPNKSLSKHGKKLAETSIPHGSDIDTESIPQSKKTFPLKMAPWIRVNGSINRRVLDKYCGTILLFCVEHVGLTLFTLCTRFHYLLPIHVYEIVQYLEDFECVTKTAMIKQRPVTLFSTYTSVNIGPATDLDHFKDIVIEPTIDAVTKISIFIGNKKYKDDFI